MVEIENLKKEILDLITPYLVERAGKIYIENEEYKESSKKRMLERECNRYDIITKALQ